ncbi:tetratricopeptide repeat protein [Terasakiella sp. SH-1]|uniref:tetratricopeptide repeat protein n=1 Tax=Terasakiella sp. SH-1 TaxID=2560057 RepID=UPI001073D6D1|nr:tetratricopeptide repeat protein [Terasakiella sp. SH-1]
MKSLLVLGTLLVLPACAPAPAPQTSGAVQQQIEQLTRLGERTAKAGDHANALGFYQRAYSLDTQNPDLLIVMADMARREGDLHKAEQIYANGLQYVPDNVEVIRLYGNVLVERNKLPQAIIQFKNGLALAPNDAMLLNSLGVALDMTGQHEAAQAQYRNALNHNAPSLDAKSNYALSLALSGHLDKAIEMLSPHSHDSTAPKRLRLNLALFYGLKGDAETAAQIAGQILDRETVKHNLQVYERLRTMTQAQRTKAVFGN